MKRRDDLPLGGGVPHEIALLHRADLLFQAERLTSAPGGGDENLGRMVFQDGKVVFESSYYDAPLRKTEFLTDGN